MLTDDDLYSIFRDQLEGPGVFTYDDAMIADIITREGSRFSSFPLKSFFFEIVRDLKIKRGQVLVAYWVMTIPPNSSTGAHYYPSLIEKPFEEAKEELRNMVFKGVAAGSSRFPQFFPK